MTAGSSGRLRAGIVGARRVRQGLGPFVARDLTAAGVSVDLVLGTSEVTAEEAAAQAAARAGGSAPRATADPEEFAAADLDLVCVLSPAGFHLDHVERALAAGRHVLCEKPLLWTPEERWSEQAADLEARARAAGLVLAVNAQWPWTLDAHAAATGPRAEVVRTLVMGLTPASRGRQMIGDALPHPLSLAQALRPDLERTAAAEVRSHGDANLEVELLLEGAAGPLKLRAHLDGSSHSASGGEPRAAWYAVDGRRADRLVDAADYSLTLRSGEREVPMPDPLTARVASFVAQVREGAPCPWTRPGDLARRAAMLEAATAAFQRVRA